MTRIEIPLSKTKLLISVGSASLFVVLGFYIILKGAHSQEDFNPLVVQGIGFVSVVFFGAIAIFGSKKIFDRTPGLIVDDKGITDNSSGVCVGLIEWNDIAGVSTSAVMTTKFLLIHVYNPEKYLAKVNKTKARIMKANMKMAGTPLSISSTALECNFAELTKSVTDAFEEYQRNTVGKGLNS
jgi:hypothetical protein